MLATGPTGTRGLLARRFALLAVLVGLLAMHGVAMSHHARASTPAAVVDAHAPTTGADHHGAALASDPTHGDQVSAAGATCDETCQSAVAMLCLAVLTTTAFGAFLVPRRVLHRSRSATGRPRAPARRSALLQSVDPVAELCVSRT